MLMGDDREAGLGLGDQDCGESAVARQDTEKESFMAEERGDCRQNAHMNVGQNDRKIRADWTVVRGMVSSVPSVP